MWPPAVFDVHIPFAPRYSTPRNGVMHNTVVVRRRIEAHRELLYRALDDGQLEHFRFGDYPPAHLASVQLKPPMVTTISRFNDRATYRTRLLNFHETRAKEHAIGEQ